AGTALPADTPAIIAIPVCVLAAAAAGGAVGGLIGLMRVTRGAHEVLTSIMLNAIVAGVALWLGNAVLFEGGTTTGGRITPGAELPLLPLGGSSANAALFLALAAAGLVWWLRARTTWGQAWRTTGRDPAAARTLGIDVGRTQILVMVASGVLAGLAATSFVLGHKHAVAEGLGRGVAGGVAGAAVGVGREHAFGEGRGRGGGFRGISVALLGRNHPAGVVLAALLLGVLSSGGLAVADLVPKELTEMLQGIVVLAVAAAGPWVARNAKEAA